MILKTRNSQQCLQLLQIFKGFTTTYDILYINKFNNKYTDIYIYIYCDIRRMISGAPWEAHWPSKLNLSGYLKVQGPSIHFHSTRPWKRFPSNWGNLGFLLDHATLEQNRGECGSPLRWGIWSEQPSFQTLANQTVQCSSAFEEREGRVSVHGSGSTTLSQMWLKGKSKIKIEASRPSQNRRK